MNDTILVFGRSRSTYVRSVCLTLEEKGAPYELRPTGPGENLIEPYLSERHPFGRIPAIQQGDFKLYESQAIMRYADDMYGGPRLQPDDIVERARMNQIIGIVDAYFWHSAAAGVIRNRLMAPRFGMEIDENAVEATLPRARLCVAEIERLITDTYLASSNLTLADLMVAPLVHYMSMFEDGQTILADHPKMARWLETIMGRGSAKKLLLEP
ncbi:glutathione S-transferase family protein [Ensifer sp. ENS04]|uniref:glutathione S-transferase family protein n=1 Tax=Ensifer sp. ENS04 TaxID=2769281 RepID=UPI00177C7CC8|nr:glutathione S-transferase family protein [Ensifer sp. ENS04]MBD9541472.1 glutathione S-transferase family protein [Ensifer sp. ENS04]